MKKKKCAKSEKIYPETTDFEGDDLMIFFFFLNI